MISDTCDLAANLACPALPSGPVFNLATASSNFCSKATKVKNKYLTFIWYVLNYKFSKLMNQTITLEQGKSINNFC